MAKELVISTGRHETRVAIMEEDQLVEIYFQRANEYSLAGSIHKGRVTRVLPGMQSAFVDLGLERDTFLYVSDFFEENEEFEKMPEGRERTERIGTERIGTERIGAERIGAERIGAERIGAERIGTERIGTERIERPDRDQNRGRGRDGRDGGRGRGRDRREPLVVQSAANASALNAPVADAAAIDAPRVVVERPASGDAEDQRRGNRRRRRGRSAQGGNFPESKFADATEEEEAVTEELESIIEAQENVDAPSMPILLPGETLSKYRGRPAEVAASFEDEVEVEADEPELAFEAIVEIHEAPVTPLKAITPESIAERLEDEVLEEVKEHLAEMAKENEEQRDFEEAERLAYQDKENAEAEAAIAASAQLDNQNLQVSDDQDSDDDNDDEVDDDAEASVSLESIATEGDEAQVLAEGESPDSDADGVLPSLGYSAHLRQTDQRFLQQRAPQEGGEGQERGGRRRRRGGRGRDRAAAPEAAAGAIEAPVVTEGEAAVVPPVEAQRDSEPRREDGRRDGRNRRDRGDRSEPRGERTATDRSDRPERSADRNDRPDRERRPQPSITELLKEGQEILVQIAKEPLGQKGARITSHIALPGRYCVYMPTVDHTGVSRKIASDEERLRLKRILQSRKEGIPGGFIIRTAGEGRTEEEILADIEFLSNLWVDIRKKAESKPAPALIYHDLEIVERVLRDQLGPDFKSIWVDNEEIYESILRFLERFQPMMVSRVKMYTRQASIFDNFGITQELEKALRPKVWLKSGGYIVINQTEALVAIDINTGKFVGKSNRLEDTIVKTNVEAIREIVRQVRLRDLGGIIVIDFIDMDERKNRMRVMQALEEAMRADRAPYKILQFNDFGLVAITRKRVKQSLERTLCAPCPYCEGSAYVKSVQTVVGEILNEAKKLARALEDSKDVLLRVNPEVAKVFKSSDNQYLEELEEIVGRPVMVVSDGLIHQEKFDLA